MNAYRPSDLVLEANYATACGLSPTAHLSHKYGITCRQFGPDRIVADGHDLMRLRTSGWFIRPMSPPISVGRADYRDILIGDTE